MKNLDSEQVAEAVIKKHRDVMAERKLEEYRRRLMEQPAYPDYTAERLRKIIPDKFKKLTRRSLVIDQHNRRQYDALIAYFATDGKPESLNKMKGLLFAGGFGVGKTSLLTCFGVNSFRPFVVKNCKEISAMYAKEGDAAILDKYSQLQDVPSARFLGFPQAGILFDDFGAEESKKHYGNEANVMQDVLELIYNRRHLIGWFHITTNLSIDEIEAKYGGRVRSRMAEMFNVISYGPDAPDRRIKP